MKPLDFIVRRTGILYFYKNRIHLIKEAVLSEFQRQFGWSAEKMQFEGKIVEAAIREVTHFI